jgi:hypothetical protein
MDLGLENFWAKEGCLSGYLFLQCVFMLTLVIVYTNNLLLPPLSYET